MRPISHSLDHATRILMEAAFSRPFASGKMSPHANAAALRVMRIPLRWASLPVHDVLAGIDRRLYPRLNLVTKI
jgi:hypothetical protein